MRKAIIGIMAAGLGVAGLVGPALAQSTTPQAGAAPAAALSETDIRALVEAARESAKAARENVDYAHVVPDSAVPRKPSR